MSDRARPTRSTSKVSRRGLLGGGALAAGGAVFAAGTGTAEAKPTAKCDSPLRPIPIPGQTPASEGFFPVSGGAYLWYWDTGGDGEPIILLHPGSGSGESWPYQQPYFVEAGYRVISYSRRGHYKSDAGPVDDPGFISADLHSLVEFLGIDRFHSVGVAYGGGVGLDYALSHPDKLLSMSISGSLTGVQEQDYKDMLKRLRPAGFKDMPTSFIELGPSYRAIDPEGMQQWVDIHERSRHTPVSQPYANKPTWADVEQLRIPTLLLWGDSDLYSPPTVQRIVAEHYRDVETAVANECGHQPHWERSDVYNPTVLKFLRRHSHRHRRHAR